LGKGITPRIFIIIVLTVVLITPSSFQNSFSSLGYFEPAVNELDQQPTICIFQPNDYRVDEKTWNRWYTEAKAAIDELRTILNQKRNLEVVEIPLEKQFLHNPAGCNIEVYYTDYSGSSKNWNCVYSSSKTYWSINFKNFFYIN